MNNHTQDINDTDRDGVVVNPLARRSATDHVIVALATGAWVGLVRFAPGTFGALWGLPLTWLVQRIGESHVLIEATVIVVVLMVGVPLTTAAVPLLGGKEDPGAIVYDEIASMPLVFLGVPLENVPMALAGFVLHRFFDVTKPPPARRIERLPGGLGIMADDVVAALYANMALRLIAYSGILAP